ncbi:40S ribosomal protein S30-A [Saitozyma sp. JCM 24511]|nr:40S ribosomal protein S30-A [Saitozyma sp. JCM 24511]
MGKVHGSLARAGKVSGVGVSVDAIMVGQGWEGTGKGRKKGGMRWLGVVQRRGRCGLGMESGGDAHMDWGEGWWIVSMRMRRGEPDVCPKVEKQEKKKQPKGRAKKRMQYNRRFVNVTLTPGGKRKM